MMSDKFSVEQVEHEAYVTLVHAKLQLYVLGYFLSFFGWIFEGQQFKVNSFHLFPQIEAKQENTRSMKSLKKRRVRSSIP